MSAESIKVIVLFVLCFCIVALALSVSYSVCTRGEAEFRFTMSGTPAPQASCTPQLGITIYGYRIEVMQEMKKP